MLFKKIKEYSGLIAMVLSLLTIFFNFFYWSSDQKRVEKENEMIIENTLISTAPYLTLDSFSIDTIYPTFKEEVFDGFYYNMNLYLLNSSNHIIYFLINNINYHDTVNTLILRKMMTKSNMTNNASLSDKEDENFKRILRPNKTTSLQIGRKIFMGKTNYKYLHILSIYSNQYGGIYDSYFRIKFDYANLLRRDPKFLTKKNDYVSFNGIVISKLPVEQKIYNLKEIEDFDNEFGYLFKEIENDTVIMKNNYKHIK